MALPRGDELSRWTVGQVNIWLQEMSLTRFREPFLEDGIDGSRLMRMDPDEIDRKYSYIPLNKRNVLKELLRRVEMPIPQKPNWITAPQLPPRPPRAIPVPVPAEDPDSSDSGDDWGSDFEDQNDDPGVYIQPTPKPPKGSHSNQRQQKPVPVPRHHAEEPQEVYEVVEDSTPETNTHRGGRLERKPTIVDKLKSALSQRQQDTAAKRRHYVENESNSDSDGESYIEPVSRLTHGNGDAAPPPRPPRKGLPTPASPKEKRKERPPATTQPGHRPPPPLPQEPKEPEDVYEVMEGDANSHADDSNDDDDDDYLQPDPARNVPQHRYMDMGESSRVNAAHDAPHKPRKQERQLPNPGATREPSPPPRPGHPKKVPSRDPPPPGAWLFNNQQAQESLREGDLSRFPWYHGDIGRTEANIILENYRTDGMFLIRASARSPDQPYTLALWYSERSWNLPIRLRDDKRYAAGKEKTGETTFGTICELVEFYKKTMLALKGINGPQLQQPAPKH